MPRLPNGAFRVLHVLSHSLPVYSGYAFRSKYILQSQRARGWQVACVTSPSHTLRYKGRTPQEAMVEGVKFYRTDIVPFTSFPLGVERSIISVLGKRIQEAISIERPDLIHVHSPALNALSAGRVCRKFGIPLVYEIRAFWEDAAVENGSYSRWSWRYLFQRLAETWACKRADGLVVLSAGLRRALVRRGISRHKIQVVPNGVEVDHFQETDSDQDYVAKLSLKEGTIGFIGSLYAYEGVEFLINAVRELLKERTDISCILVGEGPLYGSLKDQVTRHRLDEHVIVPGWIPHRDIPKLYGLCDVMVYPRKSSRLTDLVTPLKTLEAMAMGMPVVASDVGGHREIIQHNHTGILFPAGDLVAFKQVVKRLLGNRRLRNSLGSQAACWCRSERTWEKTTRIYQDVYEGAQSAGASRGE